jgi:CelD/BcsL family acetyltransferase involved in cellulose biosynthesis
VEVEDGRDRLDELLDEGFRVEGSGWKDAEGTSMRSQPRAERFYREVARWAAARGWLRLGFLRVEDRPVAFDYSLEVRGVHYFMKGGYDPLFARHSPGLLMRREMIRRAFQAGLRRYELLGEDEPWKLELTGLVHPRLRIQAFAPSPAGLAWWAAERMGRPAVRRLRRLARRG